MLSRIVQTLVPLALLVVLWAPPSRPAQNDPRLHDGEADLVLLDDKIIAVDPSDSIAEAIAVKGGRIIAVGHTEEIAELIGQHTQVVHLGGRSVLPGFVDAHTHVEGIAAFHRMLDVHVPPLKGVDDILDKVRKEANATKPGEWIVGAGGWGQILPTRQQLDAVAPEDPVVLRESAHVQILNSKALQILGIDRNTVAPRGGNISHDSKTGEPTGRIQEMSGVWLSHIPPPSYEAREQSLKEVMEDFVRKGVTSIYDFPSGDGMQIYQNLRDEGRLPLRLRCQIILTGKDLAFQQFVLNDGPRTGFGDDWLRLGGIKLFVDGETGVIPVPTGAWIYLGHAAFKTQAKVPFIYRTMLDHGLRPPGTSDSLGSMPESTNPFFSMWAMVTRKTRDGELNGAEEAITMKEAIRGYTIDGAYSGFEEKIKGSIEHGKLADLIVVSADPLSVPSDQIRDIRVLMTVINGRIVWRSET